MSSMESLDKLQAELSGNVYADAFHTLYKLSQDVSVEHSELMSQAMKWVHKEKVEPLEAENAKLRELIRLMQICIEHACMCDLCPFFVSEDMDEQRCIAEIDSRMRELGTEVN